MKSIGVGDKVIQKYILSLGVDTVHTYIKTVNDIENILSFFRRLNSVFLELLNIPNIPQDFAIDFHNEGYFGDKNTKGVRK